MPGIITRAVPGEGVYMEEIPPRVYEDEIPARVHADEIPARVHEDEQKSCGYDRNVRGGLLLPDLQAEPKNGASSGEGNAGERVQIGIFDPALPGPENRMRMLEDAFGKKAVPMVLRLAEDAGEWAFIDEIGYLESGCAAYMDAVRTLFDGKRVIAAVRKQDTPFLNAIRGREDAFCVDLDAPFGDTACVIMASGQSKRFGGNKLLADFHGEPMIGRILSATDGIFSRRVVVTRHPQVEAICKEMGISAVLHDLPYRSDTVRLGLEAVGDAAGCIFCAADQPLLRKETIASIVLCAEHDRMSIWRACHGDMPGSPVLFPRWTFDALKALPEGKGGGYVAKMHSDRVRTVPVKYEYELTDADDRETLGALLKIAMAPQGDSGTV